MQFKTPEDEAKFDHTIADMKGRHRERIVIERDADGVFVARQSGFLFSTDGAIGTFPVKAAATIDAKTDLLLKVLNEQAKAPAVTP